MQDLAQKLFRDILQLCNCCILVDVLFPRQVLAKPWPIFCLCCNATFSRQIRPIQAWSWLSGIPSGMNMAEMRLRLRNILVRTAWDTFQMDGQALFSFPKIFWDILVKIFGFFYFDWLWRSTDMNFSPGCGSYQWPGATDCGSSQGCLSQKPERLPGVRATQSCSFSKSWQQEKIDQFWRIFPMKPWRNFYCMILPTF